MLIKIKGENSSWVLFDNAEQVKYEGSFREIKSEEELQGLDIYPLDERIDILPGIIQEDISPQSPLFAGIISFLRNRRRCVVVFSTGAYICNDSGTTVEKIVK